MLKVLQYSWALTAIIGFGIALYNLVLSGEISQAVYMPFLVGSCCVILFFLFRNQEKLSKNRTDKSN